MRSIYLLLGVIGCFAFASTDLKQKVEPSAEAAVPPPKSLSAEEQTIKTYLEELFETSKKVNDAKEKAAARAKIETAFDWDKVALICLGQHWNKQKADNRNKFKSLIKEIITLSAYARMGDFWDGTSYEFTKVEVKGGKAHAVAKFTTKSESYNLEYYLEKSGKGWRLQDLSYEDIRYSENINEQIESFLAEESFASLISKMEKRRKDLLENKTKTKKLN